ncbi:MAG: WD40 repeat domain-containing protein [Chloroflexota bacterium]
MTRSRPNVWKNPTFIFSVIFLVIIAVVLTILFVPPRAFKAFERSLSPAQSWNISASSGPLVMSPDGPSVAVGVRGRGVELRLIKDGAISATLATGADLPGSEPVVVTALAFSPDGAYIASMSTKGPNSFYGVLQLWRVDSGAMAAEEGLEGDRLTEVAFSPDGAWLAAGGAGRKVLLWSTQGGSLTLSWTIPARPEVPRPDSCCKGSYIVLIRFSPDSGELVVGSADDTLLTFRIPSGEQISLEEGFTNDMVIRGSAEIMALSDNGKYIAVRQSGSSSAYFGKREGAVYMFDLWGHSSETGVLAFRPGGGLIAGGAGERIMGEYGEPDSSILLWRLSDGKQQLRLNGHGSYITDLVWTPDGEQLISSSADSTVRVWEIR